MSHSRSPDVKHRTLFTVGNAALLMFCAFVWGAQLSNVLTGSLSPLAFSFVSLSMTCVIAAVFIAAMKRGSGSPPASDALGNGNKPPAGS